MSLFIVRNRKPTTCKMAELGHRRDVYHRCISTVLNSKHRYEWGHTHTQILQYRFEFGYNYLIWSLYKRLDFSLTEDENNCLLLDLHVYRYRSTCNKIIQSWFSSITLVNFECIWPSFSNFSPNSIRTHIGPFCAVGIWTPPCWMWMFSQHMWEWPSKER